MLYPYLLQKHLFKKVLLVFVIGIFLSIELFAQEENEKFSEYPFQQESSSRVSSSGPFSAEPFNGDDFIDQAGPPVDNGLPIEDYAWILIPLAGALVIQFRKKLL